MNSRIQKAETMTEQEFQALFATPQDDEEQWFLPIETKLGAMELPIVRRQLVQEIKDQTEIKSSQRKAILRATQKGVVRANKLGLSKLSPQDIEQYKWNLFIVTVDTLIANRHAMIRQDAEVADRIAEELNQNA